MQSIDIVLEGWQENLKLDYVAKQASGAVLYQHGKSVLLASVAIDDKDIDGDFLPLSVQYIEKAYAVGKIPAGFIKREGKPGEFEVLTSRIIDRTLRPLFPKNYKKQTHISVFVLSYDKSSDLQVCALNVAACALMVSSVPFFIPVAGVRVGRIGGEFVLNPSVQEMKDSTLDLFVSGSREDLLMIEMKGSSRAESGVDEEVLLQAIEFAKRRILEQSLSYEKHLQVHKKEPISIVESEDLLQAEIQDYLHTHHGAEVKSIINAMAKSERNTLLDELNARLIEAHAGQWSAESITHNLQSYKKQVVRRQILEEGRRADGRGTKEVRPISIQTNLLPFAHGSVLFTRGQTQSFVISTLGSDNDAQSRELLSDNTAQKDFFTFHYNFPAFSVGEASMIGAVGRRELGHGNLAKKALEDSIMEKDKTIRLVSEILESNGSSSMASVCGGSLALSASGVETTGLVAGVAMGLVVEGDKYAVLTDIMGLEDHDGDMDFKVAGNHKVITAMQMDIKLGGISAEILKEVLLQAKEARAHILAIMEEARSQIILNESILPKTEEFSVPAHKIVEIIGAGGKTIKEIIERFEVSIDLDKEKGIVKIFGSNGEMVNEVKAYILGLIRGDKNPYEIGEVFDGTIKRVVDFGVFVSLPKGGDGLLHVSKFAQNKFQRPSEFFQEGQQVRCKILGLNKGKIDLDLLK